MDEPPKTKKVMRCVHYPGGMIAMEEFDMPIRPEEPEEAGPVDDPSQSSSAL